MACDTLFKDHMYTCQWSDTGPPGPLVSNNFFSESPEEGRMGFKTNFVLELQAKWNDH